jgi:hypothetical protein
MIELVVVTAISLVVLGAVLSMLDSGTKTERATEARHSALLALRAGLVHIDKDLRQAISIASTSTTSTLDMQTYVSGVQHHVVYDVSSGALRRTLDGGTPVTLVAHVTTATPFCYDPPGCVATAPLSAPSPTTLIRVTVAATPEVFSGGPITIATDIQLRNPQP